MKVSVPGPVPSCFLRRRCRVISGGSTPFLEIVGSLLSEKDHESSVAEHTALAIRNLPDAFEEAFALAALYESQGKIELMLEVLDRLRVSGYKECCRRLYAGIAREKLEMLEEARQEYQWVLRVAPPGDELVTAAQFNYEVTLEKENASEVDFSRFLSRGSYLLSTGEDLLHKALCMDLVVCTKTGRNFRYVDLIGPALEAEARTCPAGYVKTLINWAQYNGEILTAEQQQQVLRIGTRMRMNARAALMHHIIKSANTQDARVLRSELLDQLGRIARDSKSQSIRKFYEELV